MNESKTTKLDASGGTAFKTGFMGAFGVGTYGCVALLIVTALCWLFLFCCCFFSFVLPALSYRS